MESWTARRAVIQKRQRPAESRRELENLQCGPKAIRQVADTMWQARRSRRCENQRRRVSSQTDPLATSAGRLKMRRIHQMSENKKRKAARLGARGRALRAFPKNPWGVVFEWRFGRTPQMRPPKQSG